MGNRNLFIGLRPRAILAAVAIVVAVATLIAVLVPDARLAQRSADVTASYETAVALVALLAAYLMWGRFGRTGRRRDLLLAVGLTVLVGSNLVFAAVSDAALGRDTTFAIWSTGVASMVAAFLLAVAAHTGDDLVESIPAARRSAALGTAAALVIVGAVVGMLSSRLPAGVDAAESPVDASLFAASPGLIAIQLTAAAFLAIAAVGFSSASRRSNDEFLGWVGIAAALSGAARLNYALFPTAYASWLSLPDGLRAAAYVVLLIGAVREIGAYQRTLAEVGAAEERQRLARELHDGLAQDIALISTLGEGLDRPPDPRRWDAIRKAAARAWVESRTLVGEMTDPNPLPLGPALKQAVLAAIGPFPVEAQFDIRADAGAGADPGTRDALLRVAREAALNAARHAGADVIRVELRDGDGLRLTVSDDGGGFDPAATLGTGRFGLHSMRQRAELLGTRLE